MSKQMPSYTTAVPRQAMEGELSAPRRFKTAFIFFSSQRHKQIKEELAKEGKTEKTTNIAKMVSKEWREMSEEDRQVWNERSRVDKARYDHEMQDYNQARKLSKTNIKDPNAPRRPMSAFLAFSNKRRASLKREHPTATNADLSKMLSKSWKEFPHEMKKEYIEEEARLRAKYKADAVVWRKKKAEEAKASVAKQLTEEQRESSRSLAVATSTGSEISHQAAIATSKQEQSSLFPSLTTIPRNNVGIGFYPGSGNPLTSNDLLDVLHSRGFAGAPQNSIDAAILENLSDQLRLQRQVGSQQSFQQQLVSSITGRGYPGHQQPLGIHALAPGFFANGQSLLQQSQTLEGNFGNGGIADSTWPNQQGSNAFSLPPGFQNSSWFR